MGAELRYFRHQGKNHDALSQSETCYTRSCTVTPVVVIDPEDRESVQRLYDALGAGDQDSWWPRDLIGFTAALRQFAGPELEEPTGRFAEVVNAEGTTYYRAPTGTWHRSTDNLERPWDQIGAVHVVSEGVQS